MLAHTQIQQHNTEAKLFSVMLECFLAELEHI